MLTRLSDFHVDYNRESHLILPFSSLPDDTEVIADEKGIIFVRTYSYLFAVTDEQNIDISHYLEDTKIKHLIYPSSDDGGHIRYLMKKRADTGSFDEYIDVGELAGFYEETAFSDVDEEYLEERQKEGEYFFTYRVDEKIVSAAYTNKQRHMLVNVATRKDMTGRGYATALLKKTPSLYLFADTTELEGFYRSRGFETVRKYKVIER